MIAALPWLAACFGAQIRPGQFTGLPGADPMPSPGVTGNTPRGMSDAPTRSSNQICRNAPIPRGWVAVDYVPAPGVCAPYSETETGPNAALISWIARLPEQTVLLVCADQHLPRDWARTDLEAGDESSGRCPRKPGDTGTKPTVMRIQKMR
jgi:hypothetical protein